MVDDGSTDATAAVARAAGADVIVHPVNRGKGETIKTGLHYWFDRGMDFVVILDADGQHLPEEISRFVALATGPRPGKFVVGKRMNDVARMPVGAAVRQPLHECRKSAASAVRRFPILSAASASCTAMSFPELFGGAERFDYETVFRAGRGHQTGIPGRAWLRSSGVMPKCAAGQGHVIAPALRHLCPADFAQEVEE